MEELVKVNPRAAFWHGKRVLVTGHTGFKGSWLSLWLARLGATVTGVALAPSSRPNLFDATNVQSALSHNVCNIEDAASLSSLVQQAKPEIVIHLAAQSLVRAGYQDPVGTFGVNVMGTANVLEALRDASRVRVAIMVTTDKVYHNLEQIYPYREHDALGGHDPYSASKAASEMVIASFRTSYLAAAGVAVASARAGNVIGGGDWAADRLLPDAIRSWQIGSTLVVRNPHAVRPWQHVLEPLAGYLCLAEHLWEKPVDAGAFNFGPPPHEAATVSQVLSLARQAFGSGEVLQESTKPYLHEASLLALETAKARHLLSYVPRWGLQDSVIRTVNWYRQFQAGADAHALCQIDLDAFEAST